MTLDEILEQVKKLSPEEVKELVKRLVDMMAVTTVSPTPEPTVHWGENLLRLLDEIGPIDMIHPEIEDPIEWVKRIREEQRQKRLDDWGEEK